MTNGGSLLYPRQPQLSAGDIRLFGWGYLALERIASESKHMRKA